MAKLICTFITSLDGYVADTEGNFDWSTPSDEVHTFVNDLERSVGTYLYGRRLYEVMVAWETMHLNDDAQPAVMRDYTAIWQAAEKIVYSRTLAEPLSRRTRIERSFDPEAVRALKASATANLSIGGPHLAAQAFAAGLVDEVQLFISPIVVGGGLKAVPDGLHLGLELTDEYAFRNGVVYLGYRVRH
ncbi:MULTISPECIES: dihydrofolate reductase family protein [Cryobacterium]|uniref:dihydrofolate reductase family protein n=1 Tax=Cryobacterium TaxID=69578 RepID=UPI000B4D1EAE|nr:MULTISPECIES: dihydrofolate reductase family protein [Cryobacterium]ASD24141.1 deaminase [Cryobacterium sp. LW097]POH63796.1 deaminase [Cryobacterium zongtaii]TFC42107.1 deaminase [Cryobacterium sp. TMN-39-2]TFC92677.1 deaminase [Cryobacterium sp. TMT4-31]